MGPEWTFVVNDAAFTDPDELRKIFGEEAVISKVGKFQLVHLDNPDPEEVERRVAEFDPNDLFEDDCPLCQMLKDQGGSVVYD